MSSAIEFDEHWASFLARIPEDKDLAAMSLGDLQALLDKPSPSFESHIVQAIQAWREQPQASLLNCVSKTLDGQCQGPIFEDLLRQTRFILKAQEAGLLFRGDTIQVRDGQGQPIRLTNDANALTIRPEAMAKVGAIVRFFYLYARRNQAMIAHKQVKVPKILYRGIRYRDLIRHPYVMQAMKDLDINWGDLPHLHGRKHSLKVVNEVLTKSSLVDILHSPILSFTASRKVAEFFANGEGVVLALDTTKVPFQTITSCHHEVSMSGPDPMNGRLEQEWIIGLDRDYVVSPEALTVMDKDYLLAINSPLSVALLDHDDIKARYTMCGHAIESQYTWRTNNSGRLEFRISGDYYTRKGVRDKYGFDPMPNSLNVGDVEDFKLFNYEKWTMKTTSLDIPGADQEFVEESTPSGCRL
jgi:hypothetical protein